MEDNYTPAYLEELEKNCRIRITDDYESNMETILWWSDPFDKDDKKVPVLAKGDFLVITGREKSRKSTFSSSILAAKFSNTRFQTLGFSTSLDSDSVVMRFDTEQNKVTEVTNRRTFHKLCALEEDDDTFREYNLRGYTYMQKCEMIEYAMQKVIDEGKEIGLVVIDQIADLVLNSDVNNTIEVDRIKVKLEEWTSRFNTAIIVIIHTNRGGEETNGVLGTMLDKKCFGRFLIRFNEETGSSTAYHKTRDKYAKPIEFTHDEDYFPILLQTG